LTHSHKLVLPDAIYLLPNIDAVIDRRNGQAMVCYYYHVGKGPRTALVGIPYTDQFMARYRKAAEGQTGIAMPALTRRSTHSFNSRWRRPSAMFRANASCRAFNGVGFKTVRWLRSDMYLPCRHRAPSHAEIRAKLREIEVTTGKLQCRGGRA
jgi:hypothetical protein